MNNICEDLEKKNYIYFSISRSRKITLSLLQVQLDFLDRSYNRVIGTITRVLRHSGTHFFAGEWLGFVCNAHTRIIAPLKSLDSHRTENSSPCSNSESLRPCNSRLWNSKAISRYSLAASKESFN